MTTMVSWQMVKPNQPLERVEAPLAEPGAAEQRQLVPRRRKLPVAVSPGAPQGQALVERPTRRHFQAGGMPAVAHQFVQVVVVQRQFGLQPVAEEAAPVAEFQ